MGRSGQEMPPSLHYLPEGLLLAEDRKFKVKPNRKYLAEAKRSPRKGTVVAETFIFTIRQHRVGASS